MAKTPSTPNAGAHLCPTCGTRVGAAATKCLVCGTDLTATTSAAKPGRPRAAQVSLSVPLLIGVIVILLIAGAGLVYAAMSGKLPVAEKSTPTVTPSNTPLPTATFTPTPTETPIPTPTPLPPVEYSIQSGDTCIAIAFNAKISVASLEAANPTLNCQFLVVGAKIMVPQPTPTVTPLPSATLPASVKTAPVRPTHIVIAGETLAGIAKFYGINIVDLMQVNGVTDPNKIKAGDVLTIPVDLRVTPGPTPTATLPPPWAAPAILNPDDGKAFKADETITLQWAAVGQLHPAEFYYVTIEDVSCGCAQVKSYAMLENKFIVPVEMRPTEAAPHLFRWNVTTVRQRNFGANTPPVYDAAGAVSPNRGFIWAGP
jgi:LysM repeat protein